MTVLEGVRSAVPLAHWSNLAKASRVVGVHETTLERALERLDIQPETYGGKQLRIAPADVMRASLHFTRRAPNDVVVRLVRNAQDGGAPDEVLTAIEDEVHAAVPARVAHRSALVDPITFLHTAEELLAERPELVAELRRTVTRLIEIPPAS